MRTALRRRVAGLAVIAVCVLPLAACDSKAPANDGPNRTELQKKGCC